MEHLEHVPDAIPSGKVLVHNRRGKVVELCKQALTERGPMDTRELSFYVMEAKGFAEDNELRKTICFRIVQALRMQAKRGGVRSLPKRKNVRMWSLV